MDGSAKEGINGPQKDAPRRRIKTRLLNTFRVVVGTALLSALLFSYQSLYFFAYPASDRVPIGIPPVNAAEILSRCVALDTKPGVPEGFYTRTESDRFQPGTRPVLIHNATLWTGDFQWNYVGSGYLILDRVWR